MELCSQQGDGDFFVVEELVALFPQGRDVALQVKICQVFQGWFISVVCFKQEHVMDSKNTFCGICFQERKGLFFPE